MLAVLGAPTPKLRIAVPPPTLSADLALHKLYMAIEGNSEVAILDAMTTLPMVVDADDVDVATKALDMIVARNRVDLLPKLRAAIAYVSEEVLLRGYAVAMRFRHKECIAWFWHAFPASLEAAATNLNLHVLQGLYTQFPVSQDTAIRAFRCAVLREWCEGASWLLKQSPALFAPLLPEIAIELSHGGYTPIVRVLRAVLKDLDRA